VSGHHREWYGMVVMGAGVVTTLHFLGDGEAEAPPGRGWVKLDGGVLENGMHRW
jgi:hypothetical protein